MSDNSQVSVKASQPTKKKEETSKREINRGLIITLLGILITVCISGLLNPEIRRILNLDPPLQQEEVEEPARK